MPLSPQELIDLMESELGQYTPQAFPQGKSLYHYTDSHALLGILRDKAIWASDYRYLNDASEMRRGEEIVQEMAETLAKTTNVRVHRWVLDSFAHHHRTDSLTQGSGVFVASFSEEGNLLSQWRAYGANGAGYSIGFSNLKLPDREVEDSLVGVELFQCVYDEHEFRELVRARFAKVLATLDRNIEQHGIDESSIHALGGSAIAHMLRGVCSVIPRLKHAAFVEEREWRLVAMTLSKREHEILKFRGSARGMIPYLPLELCDEGSQLALSSICVGPTQNPEVGRQTCAALLSSLKYAGDKLATESGIPYRT